MAGRIKQLCDKLPLSLLPELSITGKDSNGQSGAQYAQLASSPFSLTSVAHHGVSLPLYAHFV